MNTATPNARSFRLYQTSALIIFNTIVCLVLCNILLAVAFWGIDSYASGRMVKKIKTILGLHEESARLFNPDGSPVDNGSRNSYQLAWVDFHAYEGLSPSYVADVLDESYRLAERGMVYQPWVEFAEPEFHGKLVTVERDERNFLNRRTINPSNLEHLPVVKIFALGGSTTFGYNVSDEHTWPTFLSRILNEQARAKSLKLHIEVVNYGRGYYYPSQETILLLDLLKAGHRPQLAIFLDGVNSSNTKNDVPEFYPRLKEQFHNIQFAKDIQRGTSFVESIQWIPAMRLANALGSRLSGRRPLTVAQRQSVLDPTEQQYKINTFRQNRAISKEICHLYSVTPLFILQPFAVHNYNTALYRRPMPPEFGKWRTNAQDLYARMRQDGDLIYLGDLFERWGTNRKAIVDELHYSPLFNEFLAQAIAQNIDLTTLHPDRLPLDLSAATGSRTEN